MKKTMNLKDPPLLHQAQELKEFSSTEDPGLRAGMELYLVFRGKSEVLEAQIHKKTGLFLRQEEARNVFVENSVVF